MNKKLKFSKSALVFYIMAVLTLGVCIYTLYNVTVYIQSLVDAGQLAWSTNISDIINYYINNAFVYIVYTAIFVGIGYIITLLKNKGKEELVEVMNEVVEDEVVEVIEEPTMNIEEEIKD
ncbi:MAG: hypothetical protein RR630_08945 [Coprobacillus sp.]